MRVAVSIRSSTLQATGLLANLNSLVLDYFARQSVSGVHLSDHIIRQLPLLAPALCNTDLLFVVPRVAELVYTSWDIKPFVDDMWNNRSLANLPSEADTVHEGLEITQSIRAMLERQWHNSATRGHSWDPPAWAEIAPDGCPLPPFKWDDDRRAVLRAELDAYYARLYGLNRKQLRYILDPHGLSQRELEDILDPWEDPTCAGPHLPPEKPALDFPGETFRVLKEKEERVYGEYRTRRLVLEAWERLEAGSSQGKP
jgi:hypothetical protein